MAEILIVDDDEDLCRVLSVFLSSKGHQVRTAASGGAAVECVKGHFVDAVLLDLGLPDMDGLAALEKIKELERELPVVVVSGNREIPAVVRSVKAGALQYITKPFNNDELLAVIGQAVKERKLTHDLSVLKEGLRARKEPPIVFGKSSAIQKVLKQVESVAPTDLTVVLQGESGTGKEVFARLIHQKSRRSGEPFVAADCGAFPDTLIESEFFGYEKGAFTGADQRKLGLFEMALDGTLFLDEIGNLPLAMQAKFLRVLQEKKIRRVGGQKELPVNPRILCATNLNLEEMVRAGTFREDLYHRLNQFSVTVPPLRDRTDDIDGLSEAFVAEAAKAMHKNVYGVTEQGMRLLKSYSWPGNVRELKNVILKCSLNAEDRISSSDVKSCVPKLSEPYAGAQPKRKKAPRFNLKKISSAVLEQEEKRIILEALRSTGGAKGKASKLMGISRKGLYNKMKQHGIRDTHPLD